MKTYNETAEFLKQLQEDNCLDLNDSLESYLNEESFENFDQSSAFNSLLELIEDKSGFDKEIIYYANAIEYLKENDQSLQESLEIAAEYGYELKDLNSEILASLLKTKNIRNDFYELRYKIEEFFNN